LEDFDADLKRLFSIKTRPSFKLKIILELPSSSMVYIVGKRNTVAQFQRVDL